MRNYIGVVFDNSSKAYEGLHGLWQLDDAGEITVHGAGVIHRDELGQVRVDTKETHPALGTAVGVGIGALLGALATPGTAVELAERVGTLSAEGVAGVLALFLKAGMLDVDDAGEAPGLPTWEFHDLLFHARSRRGRFDAPCGGTYRLVDRLAPPPALKPPVAGEAHELYRPDLDRLEQDDPPLARVQARRRSVREFDTPPLAQGKQFKYTVKATWKEDNKDVTQTQQVTFTAGEIVQVKFPVPAKTTGQTAPR